MFHEGAREQVTVTAWPELESNPNDIYKVD
jgi:hypothetical protein